MHRLLQARADRLVTASVGVFFFLAFICLQSPNAAVEIEVCEFV